MLLNGLQYSPNFSIIFVKIILCSFVMGFAMEFTFTNYIQRRRSYLEVDSSVKLKLIQRVMNITQNNSRTFFAKFNDSFEDIGSLPKTHHTSE